MATTFPIPELSYQAGFGNTFMSEALPGALPVAQNSPQKVPYGLYTEQFSGTAFTAPRGHNRHSWLYRIRPAAHHQAFTLATCVPTPQTPPTPPTQCRWHPLPLPREVPTDFLEGLKTLASSGDVRLQTGMAVHLYAANASMEKRFFYDADGELLIVPQLGALRLHTEFGLLDIRPGECAVLPRGVRCRVVLLDDAARGYVCENFGAPFQLPELGPIGANGLANARDFLTPVAAFEDVESDIELFAKFGGQWWVAKMNHSPCDVVAWQGNYAPYKYDLSRFNTMNTVSFDHPDPSIFTVLTSPSEIPGTANVDFVIFPPRWMVAEHTFRPPWFHRNVMSEYMGLIHGEYDAKASGASNASDTSERQGGFVPGGSSLHNCMSGHGPDAATFEKARQASLTPEYFTKGLAFMFESRYVLAPTSLALETPLLQKSYLQCWQGLKKYFNGNVIA